MKNLLKLFSLITMVTFVGCETVEPPLSLEHINETITTPTVWKLENSPHTITGSINVSGAVLTIEPGTIIRFNPGARITVSGVNSGLVAAGLPGSPVLFTSSADIPSPGDWDYIMFKDGATRCEMDYCIVEYGGNNSSWGMIDVEGNALVSINNCILSHPKYMAVESEDNGNGFVSFTNNLVSAGIGQHAMKIRGKIVSTIGTGNVFETQDSKGILVTGSSSSYNNIEQDALWKALNVPYYIENIIVIRNNSTLTIEEGATLKFYSGIFTQVGHSTGGYGRLVAQGSILKPVTFTAASPTPLKGDWKGIVFTAMTLADSKLVNCIISYGGSSKANIDINPCGAANPLISDCEIKESETYGIYIRKASGQTASPSLVNNNMHDNDSGNTGQDL